MLLTIFLCLISFVLGLYAKKFLIKLFVFTKNKQEELVEKTTEDNNNADEYETDFEDEHFKW